MNVHLKAAERRPSASRLIRHLRDVIGSERNDRTDAHLGLTLCFVAGAVNAGGFLAVGQYTSHMSGMISAMADNLALGGVGLVFGGTGAFLSFILGAACSAVLINWGRRHHTRGQYAFPLLFEAVLLLGFGLIGSFREHVPFFIFIAVPLLCFIMGLQNAIITKISRARMRTTHMTGVVTDIGIELGKLFYWNRTVGPAYGRVLADRAKLRLLASLLGSFFVGGVVGALGFNHIGFVTTVPLAIVLLLLAGVPMVADLIARRRVISKTDELPQ
jgi:uncharacterized membrane protein YoaK (UPF0700 family)